MEKIPVGYVMVFSKNSIPKEWIPIKSNPPLQIDLGISKPILLDKENYTFCKKIK
ncbi:hypothetical protein LCGC14_0997600 [marine sediment metagenome]|uniref:Uncharacterized protein n=1 Tax=marine sediment metagenome TaxID=412755 RepID=A0A0F9RA86_9ZZZZ